MIATAHSARGGRSLVALSVLFALGACSGAPVVRPELLVVVDSDVTGLDTVHVDVSGPDGVSGFERSFSLGSGTGQVRFPFSFGVTPVGGDSSRVVTITVEGRFGSLTRVREIVRSRFVAGEVRRLDVFLAHACEPLFASCEATSLTCRAGTCETPMVDATTLPPAHLDAGRPPEDGGTTCMASIGTIACGSSLVMGDTATGSSVLTTNTCPSMTRYPGKEGIYSFSSPTSAVVHITSHRLSDADHAYDLFVLGGSGAATCDSGASCADWDSTLVDVNRVDFVAVPGAPYFVVYDGVDATATTTYSLDITCDLCGDGVVTAPEQCDDHNAASGDGCAADCAIEPGFTCEGTPSVCHSATCGDHMTQRGETCDDGNATNGDGCSATCRAETFVALSLAAPSVTVPGSFDSTDPTWMRTLADCATDSGYQPLVDSYVVENTGATPIIFSAQASWMGDGFLFVYSPPFDPMMPTAGCLLGNDDFMGPGASRIDGLTIAPGAQFILVASEFDAFGAAGSYSLLLGARAP